MRDLTRQTDSVSFPARLCRDIRKNKALYLLALPAVIAIFFLSYVPMYGVVIAFKDFRPVKGIMGSDWVGFYHFLRFFQSYQFVTILKNTVTLSLVGLFWSFPVPILLALLLNQVNKPRIKKCIQTLVYLPHFIATVVLVSMLTVLLSPNMGLFSTLCGLLGVEDPPNLIAKSSAFRGLFIGSSIWQNAGWDSIIYIAALAGIDQTLYEAATVDGATKLQRVRHIDLPGILPTVITLLIMRAGHIMNVSFDRTLLLQNDINIGVSEIISTYVYQLGIKKAQYSYAAAIGLFNNAVNLILLLAVNGISKKTTNTGLW